MSTPLAALGNSADPAFEFYHANAHRDLFGAMATESGGLSRFSVLPYLLDPQYPTAGGWKQNHQEAHSDFQAVLPTWFSLEGLAPPESMTIATGQNFEDMDLTNPEQLQWWTWANEIEHQTASGVISLTSDLLFPFW